jgi:hypothetical protein
MAGFVLMAASREISFAHKEKYFNPITSPPHKAFNDKGQRKSTVFALNGTINTKNNIIRKKG